MTDYQIARLKSFFLVVEESRKKQTTIDLIPTFASGISRLEVISNLIKQHWIEQERNITGASADKLQKHKVLSDWTIEMAGAVHSYAVGINDPFLMGKVYYTSTVIQDMGQMELLAVAELVNIEAKKVPPASLAKEGITAEELVNFGELITAYAAVEPQPRGAVIERSGNTEAIRKLFCEATLLFRNTLNRLSVQFKRKDPDFYLKYRAARSVIYSSGTNTPPAS